MKPIIQVTETSTKDTKLTIAKDRVSIKYPINHPSELREREYKLALKVIDSLHNEAMVTRRGKFFNSDGNYKLTMYIQTHKSNQVDPITFIEKGETV